MKPCLYLFLGLLCGLGTVVGAQNADSLTRPRARFEWDWKYTSVLQLGGGVYTPLSNRAPLFADPLVAYNTAAYAPAALRAEVYLWPRWGLVFQLNYLTTGAWRAQFQENVEQQFPGKLITMRYAAGSPAQRPAPMILAGVNRIWPRGRWYAASSLLVGASFTPTSNAQAEVKTLGTNELTTLQLDVDNSQTSQPGRKNLVVAASGRVGYHLGHHAGLYAGLQLSRLGRNERIVLSQTDQHTGQSFEGSFWYTSPAWLLLGEVGALWHFD
jgi:hypothetical protein